MPGLFAKLPFTEAIKALAARLSISKPLFEALDASARSKAFTVARVADQRVLEVLHDELVNAMTEGESFADFKKRIADVKERTGWTGTNPGHYRLIFEQNTAMAYSAGRLEQGQQSGLTAWRYLPSIAVNPRSEHSTYYGNLYRAEPGHPMPPIDFNCACGWEWVLPFELEDMGIDPETLPTFDPPTPESGFAWDASAYLQGNSTWYKENIEGLVMIANEKLTQRAGETERVVCDAVSVGSVPAAVTLVPWGDVKSEAGDFVFDAKSADAVMDKFSARGVDMVIDYEHQSLGEQFSSPDGKAPAAGWIKRLRAGTGGLVGSVEWTEGARKMLAAREYRYLSPVVIVSKATRKVVELISVALTNMPAIAGMKPIVNSTGSAAQRSAVNSLLGDQIMTTEELKTLAGQINESFDLTAEEKLARFIEAIDQLNAEPEAEGATEEVAGSLKPIAAALGLAETADAETIVNAVKTATARMAGMVEAKEVSDLNKRIAELEADRQEREAEAVLIANSNKLAPAKIEWWKKWRKTDPEGADKFLEEMPVIVNSKVPGSTGGPDKANDRGSMIVHARRSFSTESAAKIVVCSERVWVDGALREAGQKKLTDEEAAKYSLVA